MPDPVAILILAAGASSRMRGADKLLEPVDGRPLLAERAEAALTTGATVVVALPARDVAPARWRALEGLAVTCVTVEDAAAGMAASLVAGLHALPADAAGVLILLADMPEITPADMRALLDDFDGSTILRGAGADGTPGHPVLFAARDFAALAQVAGDQGARDVLSRERARVRLVPLPDAHAVTDLDSPEDWASWRRSGRSGDE